MRHITLFSASLLLLAAPAYAEDKDKAPPPPPPVFQAVLDCKAIADPTERLACYDRTIEAMGTATRERELVVTDRSSMRETRRGLFGLSLPKLRLFSGDASEEVTEIEGKISSISIGRDGFPTFVLEDGARWKQTEGRDTFPRVGNPIRIRKGAMGGFLANVNGRTAVRVMRVN